MASWARIPIPHAHWIAWVIGCHGRPCWKHIPPRCSSGTVLWNWMSMNWADAWICTSNWPLYYFTVMNSRNEEENGFKHIHSLFSSLSLQFSESCSLASYQDFSTSIVTGWNRIILRTWILIGNSVDELLCQWRYVKCQIKAWSSYETKLNSSNPYSIFIRLLEI